MSARPSPGVHLVPVAVAPLLLVGVAFGAEAGWLPNLLVLLAVGALLRRLQPGLERSRERGLPSLGLVAGVTLTSMGLLSAIVLAGAAGLAVGELLVAFPAAIWGLPVLVLAGLLKGRARSAGVWALALAVPLAGSLGDDFEAKGDHADGWAHSGPIAGVHPFQMTAVVIDGFGPFDLPINDYVEPDSSRGYGPHDLEVSLEQTLHRLAEIHFADGPARARKAFGEASVEVGEIPQLYEENINPLSLGLLVASGTHGERSRVEFVCPGQVLDPRPRRPDMVMRDSCPDKYASEASAGLGLTGRWAGYTEARGNARLSLARLFGATRTDDERGREVIEAERAAWGAGLLLIAFVSARRRDPLLNAAGVGGATAALGLALGFVAMVALVEAPSVPALGSIPAAAWGIASALAALAGLAGLVWLEPGRRDDGSIWVSSAVGLLALGSVWTLASPAASVALAGVQSPGELVAVIADASSLRTGLDVEALEGAIAACLVAILVGATLLIVGPMGQASVRLGLDIDAAPRWPTWIVAAGALVFVLVVPPSRMSLLLGVGLAALMSSAVSIASRRQDGAPILIDLGVHALLVAGLMWTMAVTISVYGFSVLSLLALVVAGSFGLLAALLGRRNRRASE